VQIFTPLPSTYSSLMYFTGIDPFTGRKIFQDKLQNNPISKYRISVNEGYYLVNVITPDNTYHQKVYLK